MVQHGRMIVRLRGRVTSGKREAPGFTELPWVKSQFTRLLGKVPYPGTFNLNVVADDIQKLASLKGKSGCSIKPESEDYCAATAFHARVEGKIHGLAVLLLVPDYPPAQLEIVADRNIRQALGLKEGEIVEVEIDLQEQDSGAGEAPSHH